MTLGTSHIEHPDNTAARRTKLLVDKFKMTLLTRHGHVACRDSPSTQAARGHTFPLAFIRRFCTADLNHVPAQSVCHDVVHVAVFNTTFFVVPRDAVWPRRYGDCRLRSKILSNLVAF
jgi:hypothetical protein